MLVAKQFRLECVIYSTQEGALLSGRGGGRGGGGIGGGERGGGDRRRGGGWG